ncbi:MAG: hypothetical protein JST16_06045 [Bdellovibrionales bacterium]|nr:hypothetical protein [Bdellovibrionales bacterium]
MSLIAHILTFTFLGSAIAGASEVPDFHCFNHGYQSTDIVVTHAGPRRVRIVLAVHGLWAVEDWIDRAYFVPEPWHTQMENAMSQIVIEGDTSFETSYPKTNEVQVQLDASRVQYLLAPYNEPEQLLGEEIIPKLTLTSSTNIGTGVGMVAVQIEERHPTTESPIRALNIWAYDHSDFSSCNLLPPSP